MSTWLPPGWRIVVRHDLDGLPALGVSRLGVVQWAPLVLDGQWVRGRWLALCAFAWAAERELAAEHGLAPEREGQR